MGSVRVELLVVPGCPHEREAAALLRRALDDTGRSDVMIEIRVMTQETVAATPTFGGSPTVVIDDVDPFADQRPTHVELSCRLYRTSTGVAGVPSLEALRAALHP